MAYFRHFTFEKIGARLQEVHEAVIRHRLPLHFRLSHTAAQGWMQPEFDDASWGEPIDAGANFRAREETCYLRSACPQPNWPDTQLAAGFVLTRTPIIDGKLLRDETGYVESLIHLNGELLQAADRHHRQVDLPSPPAGGAVLAAVSYIGLPRMGVDRALPAAEAIPAVITLEAAELQGIDRAARALYHDMAVAYQCAACMDRSTRVFAIIISILDEVTERLDFRAGRGQEFYASIGRAGQHLQQELYERYRGDPAFSPKLWAVGHAHIDNAWLWRTEHTRKKCECTFSTALRFIHEYPAFGFICSQAQQYRYVQQDNPELFARIKAAVAGGRWEPAGGMWVETDCNIVSGESLVRQFLYGTRFFLHEFGATSAIAWLPDVFGFTASLPQIMRQAGYRFFLTTKLVWSQVNKAPYHTFQWEGIDGTSVLAHIPPQGNYSCTVTPEELMQSWERYDQKHLTDMSLYIYGHGDGGGGPSREMLEFGKRLTAFPGMPALHFRPAEEFFETLETQVAQRADLPRWAGELYLEIHLGTYTSQAWIKRANRLAEISLMRAEQIAAAAMLLTGCSYPEEELHRAWELVLTNQFHDVVTGSSILQVYEDAAKDYERVFAITDRTAAGAAATLTGQMPGTPGDVMVYNPLSWERSDTVKAPHETALSGQAIEDLDGQARLLIELPAIPPLGYKVCGAAVQAADQTEGFFHADAHLLENEFFRLELDDHAEIRSLVDKRCGREVIDTSSYCKGNALLVFEDKPLRDDAWDIDIFYRQKLERITYLDDLNVVEHGPLRVALLITRTFGRGTVIRQKICLYRALPRIDFETQVDWCERQSLLKTAFPVKIYSRTATYDIQFGNIERPTHWNTSWDWARFEVCGHKWADLSEADYGVSLLNDCKYGWDIQDNVIRLTLLRAPIQPDPAADLGLHHFTYSLYPHLGDWRQGAVPRRAYELNVPPLFAAIPGGGTLPSAFSFAAVSTANLVIETIKKAEDSEDIVLRLYEAHGQRGAAEVRFGFAVEHIAAVNLQEKEACPLEAQLSADRRSVRFDYRPYEIKTFRITAQSPFPAPIGSPEG